MDKKKRNCVQRLCCYVTIVLVLGTAALLGWYFAFFAKDVEVEIASCGDCHCIPDEKVPTCPESPPVSEFSQEQINTWKSQTAINPYTLNCNPYEDGTFCDTEPPLDTDMLRLGEVAVCAVHYEAALSTDGDTQHCENISYNLKSYASKEAAEAAGGFVTHTGACGVCSTMQDMAVYAEYLQPTSPGNFCRRQSFTSLENGIACYRSLGMTQDCARIWADTSWNTAKKCFASCVVDPTLPEFGVFGGGNKAENPQPSDLNATDSTNSIAAIEDSTVSRSTSNVTGASNECGLDDCLICDQDSSRRLFDRYAGRNRQRSGLLTTVPFSCSTLTSVVQDPCPSTIPIKA